MDFLFTIVVAMAVSMAIIPLAWRAAPSLNMVDRPDPRKVHSVPIPRVGGWGIVFGALVPVLILLPLAPLVKAYLIGSVVLFAFGAWDDSHEIGHYPKFIGQIFACALIVYYGELYVSHFPFLDPDALSPAFGRIFTVIALVGTINAVNHSDGLDGLAAGEVLLTLLVVIFLGIEAEDNTGTIIAAAAIGGLLGFLRYNTHPARVFMGDAGSQFLGYTVGFLAVLLTQRMHAAMTPSAVLLMLGLPIIDIIAVLIQRISGGMNWFKATRNHIHHRLLDLGFDHYETVIIIYTVQALFIVAAVVLRYASDAAILGLYALITALIFGVLQKARRSGWHVKHRQEISALTRLVTRFKQSDRVAAVSTQFVRVAIPVYLIYKAAHVPGAPRDFGLIAAVVAIAMAVELISGRAIASPVTRICIYVAVAFTVYLSPHTLSIAGFIPVGIAVAFSVGWDGAVRFRTTTTDYLVLFGLGTLVVLGGRYIEISLVTSLIVKTIVLLYGCEVTLSDTRPRRIDILHLGALGSLCWLAWLGLHGT